MNGPESDGRAESIRRRLRKDFYDLYAMAGAFRFERSTLARAVRATFDRRRTPPQAEFPAALVARFYADEIRASQWRAYVDRSRLTDTPADFAQVGELLISFLQPIWTSLSDEGVPAGDWEGGGPWR